MNETTLFFNKLVDMFLYESMDSFINTPGRSEEELSRVWKRLRDTLSRDLPKPGEEGRLNAFRRGLKGKGVVTNRLRDESRAEENALRGSRGLPPIEDTKRRDLLRGYSEQVGKKLIDTKKQGG